MFDLLNLNPNTFGLDISDLSLKIVKLKKQGDKLKFSAMNESSLSPGVIQQGEIKDEKKLAQAIKQLVNQTDGLGTRHVVVS
jgi:Tfp pilus assembly PilM family ATPase